MDQSLLLAPATPALAAWCARFARIHLDLGTGDAAFALRLARQQPDLGVIGVDTCLDHVRVHRRRHPANLVLLRCDAAALPAALDGRIASITINFPFGSLLNGLLDGDDRLLARLATVLTSDGRIELRLNVSALRTAGATLDQAEHALRVACQRLGCGEVQCQRLDAAALRRFPSTWAKRTGSGREAAAVEVIGRATAPRGAPPTPCSAWPGRRGGCGQRAPTPARSR